MTHVSPLTKIPMKFEEGVINFSLKSLIENYAAKHNIDLNAKREIKINLPEVKAEKIEFEELSAHIVPKGVNPYYDSVHIRMKPKKITAAKPICLIGVVDVSGSMGSNCCENMSSMENMFISRLELVKHSLKTIIASLRSIDTFSIITFSNNAKTVIPPTVLANQGVKDQVVSKLNSIEEEGMTNMWSGIKLAIEQANSIESGTYQKSIMIFTDGMTNSDPPKGIVPTLKETLATCKNDFLISSFSFGNNVDSKLLIDIAKLGNGIYGFCPDASMVGTIFINYMANLLSTVTGIVKVSVESNDGKKRTKTIGPLYRNSYRNAMFMIDMPEVDSLKVSVELPLTGESFEVPVIKDQINLNEYIDKMAENVKEIPKGNDDEMLDEEVDQGVKDLKIEDIDPNQPVQEIDLQNVPYEEALMNEIYREKLISLLNKVIDIKKENIPKGKKNILDFNESLKNLKYKTQFIKDLSLDIIDEDPNHGQIEKALDQKYYGTWGNRYLTSFFRFHVYEQCGNFKDASLQSYGQHVFSVYRKMANDLFAKLPPPKIIKSSGYGSYSSSVVSNYNMNSFNDPHGGCFNGDAVVLLANNKMKLVKNLKKGDTLNNGAKVVCLIEEKPAETNPLISNINGVLFTPYHPVLYNGKWSFPIDIAKPEHMPISSWFNLVLKDDNKKYEVEFENGIKAITLGHYRTENDVLKHPYFGTDEVLKDLKERDPIGYENGYIFVEKNSKIQLNENNLCVNYYKVIC